MSHDPRDILEVLRDHRYVGNRVIFDRAAAEIASLRTAQEWQDISTAVEAERKACAKLAGDTALAWDNTLGGRMIGEEVSKAILARGTLFADERGTK